MEQMINCLKNLNGGPGNNFSIKPFVVLLLFIAFFGTVQAQKVYTLDEAISTALSHNNETKIALMEVNKAEAAVDEAFGYALPTINLSGNFAHFLEKPMTPFLDFGTMLMSNTYRVLFDEKLLETDRSKLKEPQMILQSFVQSNSYEAKAELTQILFNSAVFNGIGASKIYLNTSKELLRGNVNKTVLNVKKAFYGTLLTKDLLRIMKESLENARENLKNLKAMYDQGLVSEYDVLQVEVQVDNLNPTVLELENALKGAKDGLKIVMGIDQAEDIDINGELNYNDEKIPDMDATINDAVVSNPDLKSLECKMNVDQAMIDLKKAEYWPTVAAFGNYTYAGTSETLNFMNYSSAMVGLSFSINLFQGNQTNARVEQSTIAYEQTREQLALLKEATKAQVKSKILELQRVKSLISAHDRTIALAEKTYKIAMVRFKEGTGTQLEIKNADLEIRTAKTNRLQSVHNYMVAKSELETLLGVTDSKYIDGFKDYLKND